MLAAFWNNFSPEQLLSVLGTDCKGSKDVLPEGDRSALPTLIAIGLSSVSVPGFTNLEVGTCMNLHSNLNWEKTCEEIMFILIYQDGDEHAGWNLCDRFFMCGVVATDLVLKIELIETSIPCLFSSALYMFDHISCLNLNKTVGSSS